MTPDDLPGYLQDLIVEVRNATPEVAMAMATTYQRYVKNITLRQYFHPALTWTLSPPNTGTPAWVSGNLARSIRTTAGQQTATTASASVGPWIVYGAAQEFGASIWHKRASWLHWENIDARTGLLTQWYMKHVILPPRPYLRPAVADLIANGGLQRAAMISFESTVYD